VIDIVAGAVLALSPWLFGFADDGTQFWLPFVVIGVAAIFLGLTTKQGSYSYRRADTATPAAG
jgi:SPW repeat